MWRRFTEHAQRTIFFAQEEAQQRGENYVSPEHILLGLVRLEKSVAVQILEQTGVSVGRIRLELADQVPHGNEPPRQEMFLTPRAKQVIDLAYEEARLLGSNALDTTHLLLGLIREGDGPAARVLSQVGAELERIREDLRKLRNHDIAALSGPVQPE